MDKYVNKQYIMHVLKLRAEEKKIFSLLTSSPNKLLYDLGVSFSIRAFPFAKDLSMILVYAFVLSPFLAFIPLMSGRAGVQPGCPELVLSWGKGWLAWGQGDAWLEDGGRVGMEPYFIPTEGQNTTLASSVWTKGEPFLRLSTPTAQEEHHRL